MRGGKRGPGKTQGQRPPASAPARVGEVPPCTRPPPTPATAPAARSRYPGRGARGGRTHCGFRSCSRRGRGAGPGRALRSRARRTVPCCSARKRRRRRRGSPRTPRSRTWGGAERGPRTGGGRVVSRRRALPRPPPRPDPRARARGAAAILEALPRGAAALVGSVLGGASLRRGARTPRPDSPIFEVDLEEAAVAAEKALDVLLADVVAQAPYVDARHGRGGRGSRGGWLRCGGPRGRAAVRVRVRGRRRPEHAPHTAAAAESATQWCARARRPTL